jgi:hypothetical protein
MPCISIHNKTALFKAEISTQTTFRLSPASFRIPRFEQMLCVCLNATLQKKIIEPVMFFLAMNGFL